MTNLIKEKLTKDKNNRLSKNKKMAFTVGIIIILVIPIAVAWFYYGKKYTKTDSATIMTPYSLYLLEPNRQDRLRLTVGNLHPGETKSIVVCVSSHDVGSNTTAPREGAFPYTLELAYTTNLPLNYTIYEVEKAGDNATSGDYCSEYTTTTGDTTSTTKYWFNRVKKDGSEAGALVKDADNEELSVSNNQAMYGTEASKDEIVNWATYDTYKKSKLTDSEFQLSLNDKSKQYNYFAIEISWKDDIGDFSLYTKETDLVYLIARAGVPKPVEVTTK